MKLLDFIACDDVRQEIGGKTSLMGVYSNLVIASPPTANAPTWPFQMRLSFFIRCMLESGDVKPDSFRVECLRSGEVFSHVDGVAPMPEGVNIFALIIVNPAFPIQGTGPISFRVIFKKEDKTTNDLAPGYPLDVQLTSVVA